MGETRKSFLILVYVVKVIKHYPHIAPCLIEMENRIQIDEVPG